MKALEEVMRTGKLARHTLHLSWRMTGDGMRRDREDVDGVRGEK